MPRLHGTHRLAGSFNLETIHEPFNKSGSVRSDRPIRFEPVRIDPPERRVPGEEKKR
jgi:hypothetical protein